MTVMSKSGLFALLKQESSNFLTDTFHSMMHNENNHDTMKSITHAVLKRVQFLCASAMSYLKQLINSSDEVDVLLQGFYSILCFTKASCPLLPFFTKEKSL